MTGWLDNDTAADFGGDLDEATLEEREALIPGALKRAADPADFLDTSDGERAPPHPRSSPSAPAGTSADHYWPRPAARCSGRSPDAARSP
ncbi:DUF4259 domain-containing protein [Streptomyces ossamyceticus]